MAFSTIALLLVSGLGVLHGVLLALFLFTNSGKNTAYKLLGFLLFVLSFRVGKSVFLFFGPDLDIKWIFTGLATLTLIGPLYLFFVRSLLHAEFKWKIAILFHLIPFFFGIGFGIWIDKIKAQSVPELFFVLLFGFYYLHYLVYLFYGYREIVRGRNTDLNSKDLDFLQLVFFGLISVWVVYVLNLFEEQIPYIIGPILYSLIAYGISYIVIKNGYVRLKEQNKYSTSGLSNAQIKEMFEKVSAIVVSQKEFSNPDLSLRYLSEKLKFSPQSISQTINQESGLNFNQFVNQHRVREAEKLLNDSSWKHLTISAIAFEVGFNSLTSFNAAFKKHTGKTPSSYREGLNE